MTDPGLWWLLKHRLRSWWRRPSAADRVLCELVVRQGDRMAGLDIANGASVGRGSIYTVLARLEDEGLVASEVDHRLTVYSSDRALHRRRYWLTEAGRRRALEVPRW